MAKEDNGGAGCVFIILIIGVVVLTVVNLLTSDSPSFQGQLDVMGARVEVLEVRVRTLEGEGE